MCKQSGFMIPGSRAAGVERTSGPVERFRGYSITDGGIAQAGKTSQGVAQFEHAIGIPPVVCEITSNTRGRQEMSRSGVISPESCFDSCQMPARGNHIGGVIRKLM